MKKLSSRLICLLAVISMLASFASVSHAEVEVVGNYPDVSEGSWYYDAVTFCASEGWIKGYSNGRFGPADKIQRQDFVLILSRVAGVNLNCYSPSKAISKFSDVNDANAYYARALSWGIQTGIVNGYQNGRFGVGDSVTREQICVFMKRYVEYRTGKSIVVPATMLSNLTKFKDGGRVSSFAKDSVAWSIEKKVIKGTVDGYLNPTKFALRCEVAQIFYNCNQNGLFGIWIDI